MTLQNMIKRRLITLDKHNLKRRNCFSPNKSRFQQTTEQQGTCGNYHINLNPLE